MNDVPSVPHPPIPPNCEHFYFEEDGSRFEDKQPRWLLRIPHGLVRLDGPWRKFAAMAALHGWGRVDWIDLSPDQSHSLAVRWIPDFEFTMLVYGYQEAWRAWGGLK